MSKQKKSVPKARNKLHEVLAMKATSNAAGKHAPKLSKKALKTGLAIERLFEEHLY